MKRKIITAAAAALLLAGCSSGENVKGTYHGIREGYTFTINDEVREVPQDELTYSFGDDGACSYYSKNDGEWDYSCSYEKKNGAYEVKIWEKEMVRDTVRPTAYRVKFSGNKMTITWDLNDGPKDFTFPKENDSFVTDEPHDFYTWGGYYDRQDDFTCDDVILASAAFKINCRGTVTVYRDNTVTMHVKVTDNGSERFSISCEHADMLDQGDNAYIISDNGAQIGIMAQMSDGRWLLASPSDNRYFMIFADGNKTPEE